MPTPSTEIIQILSIFAIAFTVPTFAKVMVLIYGTILAPGRRTVTTGLRAMGLADDKRYGKYHRVLNRDRWSPWVVSKILLSLLVRAFVPERGVLLIAVDEHLDRRRGRIPLPRIQPFVDTDSTEAQCTQRFRSGARTSEE